MRASLLGILLFVGAAQAAEPSPATAEEAYRLVSTYRDAHNDVIWDGKSATPDELRHVVADLEAGLRRMDEPTIHDLAEGDLFLRFRRYNLLLDLAKVQARLGNESEVIAAVKAMAGMSWTSTMWSALRDDANVRAILDRHPEATLPERVMRRFAEDGTLAASDASTTGQRVAGLARIWSVARDGFVWFDHAPDLDWDRRFVDFVPRVVAATGDEAYYRELMRFVAGLGDGHSNVYVPQRLAGRFYARPGIRTRRVDGHVLVTDVATNLSAAHPVQPGDELLAIDGIPVDAYVAAGVTPFESASTPQDLEIRSYRYALLAGPEDRPVALSMQDAAGRPYAVTLARALSGFTWDTANDGFRMQADGIAVLTLRQLDDDAGAKALEAHLDALKAAKGLVIDIRGNGGGSSNNGYSVLSWLQRTPIPTTLSRYRDTTPYRSARSGPGASTEWRSLDHAPFVQSHPFVFDGPVALLVDAGTFSAAEDMAAAFKLSRRGTIIGSPTGGSTGQPFVFAIPGGGTARICVKRDEYPDGTTFVGTGVLPDRIVTPSVADMRAHRDPVLASAVAVIAQEVGR